MLLKTLVEGIMEDDGDNEAGFENVSPDVSGGCRVTSSVSESPVPRDENEIFGN